MLYFRMMLIMGVTLYTSRVVLEVLGVEDFGIYNVVGGVVVMFGFLNSAMSSATQRFLSFELGKGDIEQLKKIFSLSVSIHVLIAIAILILSETIGLWFLNTQMTIPPERMSAANWVYQFSVFSFMVNVITVPYSASIISRERMNVYAYVSIVEVVFKLVIVCMLLWLGFDKLKLYAMLIFIVSLLCMFVYQIYCRRTFEETKFRFIWDKELFLRLISFSGWALFGNLSVVFRLQGTNLVLNIFFGPTVNAARGIAYQLDAAVECFVSNFQMALNPAIIKSYATDRNTHVQALAYQGGRYSYYLLLLLSVPVFFQTEQILAIWLKTVPEYSTIFTQLILINGLLDSFSKPLTVVVQASGQIRFYQMIQGTWLLIALPVIYVILKLGYSPPSAIIVLIIFTFVGSILRFFLVKRVVPFLSLSTYLREVILNLTLVSFFSFLCCFFILKIEYGSMFMSVAVHSMLMLFITGMIIWFFGLNRKEKGLLMTILKNRILKYF